VEVLLNHQARVDEKDQVRKVVALIGISSVVLSDDRTNGSYFNY
jgi:hypothetical protein